jgi:hypothetical protein
MGEQPAESKDHAGVPQAEQHCQEPVGQGAANATHWSCRRSTPRARRKRPTSDPAAATTASVVAARATWLATSRTPPWPRRSKGPPSTS